MYESERERLKTAFEFSEEEKYNAIKSATAQLNRDCGVIFNGENRGFSMEILSLISIWAIECDGVTNAYEIKFLEGFFKKYGITAKVEEWCKCTADQAKKEIKFLIAAAVNNVRVDREKKENYFSLVQSVIIIFAIFATADGNISDDTCRAYNELFKMFGL